MSLETVVEDIREEARQEAEEIRESAKSEAEEIIAKAEADAEATIEQAENEAERLIEQERDQELSSAALEAKQTRLEARRDILESIRDDLEDRIANIEGDQRESLTEALIEAALKEFDADDNVIIRGRADDETLLTRLVADNESAEIGDPIECLGGVVVEGASGRLRVDNTFDSVLETVWDEELKELADRLFEQ